MEPSQIRISRAVSRGAPLLKMNIAAWPRRVESRRAMTDKLKYAISAIRRLPRSAPHLHNYDVDPRTEKLTDALNELADGLEEEIARIEEKIQQFRESGQ